MAVTYTDTFTAANGTLLSAHTADTGQTYTSAATLEVQSNTLESTATSTTIANVVETQVYTTDYAIEFDLTVQTGATAKHGMAACMIGTSEFYWIRFDPTINEIQLYRTLIGNLTLKIGQWDYGSWTGPVSINIKLTIGATTLKVAVDGVEDRISITNTEITRTGDIGFRMFGNTGVIRDNAEFVADPKSGGAPGKTDVNTTNTVQVDDTPTVTGTSFLATAGSQAWNAETVGVDTWADTSILCTAITRGDKSYDTNYDWIVTDNLAVDSAALSVQLEIETGFQFVSLVDPIIALVGGEITSLCYNTSPACVTGDQLKVPLLTDQGKAIDISAADGTFVITAAGNTLQTFSFEIWDATGPTNEKWSLSIAAVINGIIVSGGIVTPLTQNLTSDLTESLT